MDRRRLMLISLASAASGAATVEASRVAVLHRSMPPSEREARYFDDSDRTRLVEGLARPGGNITGQAIVAPEFSSKRLERLKEALPGAARGTRD